MQKIELKHVAPYLPYNLKMIQKNDWHGNDWSDYKIVHLTQISDSEADWFYIGGSIEGNWSHHTSYEQFQFKPILRPLSDMTAEKLVELKFPEFDIYEILTKKAVFNLPHYIYEQLLAYHFDVFSLIPAGLAIDINTI